MFMDDGDKGIAFSTSPSFDLWWVIDWLPIRWNLQLLRGFWITYIPKSTRKVVRRWMVIYSQKQIGCQVRKQYTHLRSVWEFKVDASQFDFPAQLQIVGAKIVPYDVPLPYMWMNGAWCDFLSWIEIHSESLVQETRVVGKSYKWDRGGTAAEALLWLSNWCFVKRLCFFQ